MRSADVACFNDPDPFVTMRIGTVLLRPAYTYCSAFEIKFLLGGVLVH
jgi:hypothetical protein